ncbi:metallophosphoesterase [Gordonia sp. (in: high G+C Gram-positive bacteria)]|uniref:metallophosphoesterase n=1 Tax=Gordonia sp. (in: high G+C Gram-positive bacteria) TaxID=84139 RepID=UPI0035298767
MRIAVIGDIGGHLDELCAELRLLGVEREGWLPDDLAVVQVGDLVHRGPESDAVVELVGTYLDNNPGRWIQLIGNHEALYLRTPEFHWPEQIGKAAAKTLRKWWKQGKLVGAAAIVTADESFLVTHAGVTAGFWSAVLDAPGTPGEAAARLNRLARSGDAAFFSSGLMLTGRANPYAGPIWAESSRELIPGWADAIMPFSQIHGHSGLVDWQSSDASVPAPGAVIMSADFYGKHSTVWVAGNRIVGIDPGHGPEAVKPWRSFVVEGYLDAE